MMESLEKFLIKKEISLIQAMNRLDVTAEKILFVVSEENRLLGSLTDGDIRRWILSTGNLNESVEKVCNVDPLFVEEGYSFESIKQRMVQQKIECFPVIKKDKTIVELLFWDKIFNTFDKKKGVSKLNIPIVIMAGGKGTRLDPFTKILPKPLIPIGDKSILEIIIGKFLDYDVESFYISVNHKAILIKSYFEELKPNYKIKYIEENKPLGTAGCLKYIINELKGSFLVTNCDIIINTDYAELVDFHYKNNHDITLVASMKNYNIPYGICEIGNGGDLSGIREKPAYSFLINTGMYILKSECLNQIPDDTMFHMTDLIEKVKSQGGRVGVYPVSENSWVDIGEWAEYKKAVSKIDIFK